MSDWSLASPSAIDVASRAAGQVVSAEFCFRCGYDLTGLSLPRPCPECGQPADPSPACCATVREWFQSRAMWLWWLRPASKLPLGVWYGLDDAPSARTARRRKLLLLWLPVLLATLFIVAGNCVELKYEKKRWYYRNSDPARKPLRLRKHEITERIYCFNFDLDLELDLDVGSIFFGFGNPPMNSTRVIEKTLTRVELAGPEFDFLTWSLLGMSWAPLLLIYGPGRLLSAWLARRVAKQRRDARFHRSGLAAFALVAAVMGPFLWLWLVTVTVIPLAEVWEVENVPEILLILVAVGVLLTLLVAWPRLLALDHARLVFPHRWIAAFLLVSPSVLLVALLLKLL